MDELDLWQEKYAAARQRIRALEDTVDEMLLALVWRDEGER